MGWQVGQKMAKKIGYPLWMTPKLRTIYPKRNSSTPDVKTSIFLGSEKVRKNEKKGMFPEGMKIYRLKVTFP